MGLEKGRGQNGGRGRQRIAATNFDDENFSLFADQPNQACASTSTSTSISSTHAIPHSDAHPHHFTYQRMGYPKSTHQTRPTLTQIPPPPQHHLQRNPRITRRQSQVARSERTYRGTGTDGQRRSSSMGSSQSRSEPRQIQLRDERCSDGCWAESTWSAEG